MSGKIVQIEILRCPKHGAVCVAIGDVRVTSTKCCGGWERLQGWTVPAAELREAVRAAPASPSEHGAPKEDKP